MRRTKPQPDLHLRTKRLLLRPIYAADFDGIVAGIGDFAVSRMLARVPYPYTRADAEGFAARSRHAIAAGRSLVVAIEHKGNLAGAVSIEAIPFVSELGYWLARPIWGQGLMTEAAGALVSYAFDVLGLSLIRSGYFVENEGSRRVQRKLGFRPIGRSMKRSLARNEAVEHIDTVLTPARFRAPTV